MFPSRLCLVMQTPSAKMPEVVERVLPMRVQSRDMVCRLPQTVEDVQPLVLLRGQRGGYAAESSRQDRSCRAKSRKYLTE
jgi:hypothetical protein